MPADDVNSDGRRGAGRAADAAGGVRPDVDGVLESVCRRVSELIAALPGPPPRRVVLHIGETYLEIESAPPEPAPAQATGTATGAAPDPAAGGASPVDGPADRQVTAPAVGTFHRRPEPAADPFVEVGDQVEAGRQVAIVEAMKLMIPVEAPTAGTVTAVHADDGAPVEFGRPLLSIRPEGR